MLNKYGIVLCISYILACMDYKLLLKYTMDCRKNLATALHFEAVVVLCGINFLDSKSICAPVPRHTINNCWI